MAQIPGQSMQAAVCYEYGAPLSVEEVYLAPPGPDEVQVEMKACAICHSDVHIMAGEWHYETPMIAGHEAAGVITALGSNVSEFTVGDRVVVSLLWSCQHCRHCLDGEPYLCIGDYVLERHSKLTNRKGIALNRGLKVAGFAEHAVVHRTQLVKVPEDVPITSAALLACGVITGLGAVVNTAGFKFGESTAVIGCGGVGLNSVQGARLAGATQVIAIDIEPSKLESAKAFGATHVVNSRTEDPVKAVLDLSGGGVDYVFVVVGLTTLIEQASEMLCQGGQVIQVGLPPNRETFAFPGQRFRGQRSLKGSTMGGTNLAVEVPRLISLYQQGRLILDELVTRTYPLDQINEAISDMEQGNTLRNVIAF